MAKIIVEQTVKLDAEQVKDAIRHYLLSEGWEAQEIAILVGHLATPEPVGGTTEQKAPRDINDLKARLGLRDKAECVASEGQIVCIGAAANVKPSAPKKQRQARKPRVAKVPAPVAAQAEQKPGKSAS